MIGHYLFLIITNLIVLHISYRRLTPYNTTDTSLYVLQESCQLDRDINTGQTKCLPSDSRSKNKRKWPLRVALTCFIYKDDSTHRNNNETNLKHTRSTCQLTALHQLPKHYYHRGRTTDVLKSENIRKTLSLIVFLNVCCFQSFAFFFRFITPWLCRWESMTQRCLFSELIQSLMFPCYLLLFCHQRFLPWLIGADYNLHSSNYVVIKSVSSFS